MQIIDRQRNVDQILVYNGFYTKLQSGAHELLHLRAINQISKRNLNLNPLIRWGRYIKYCINDCVVTKKGIILTAKTPILDL